MIRKRAIELSDKISDCQVIILLIQQSSIITVKSLEIRVRDFDYETISNTIAIRFIVKTNLLPDIPSIVRMDT